MKKLTILLLFISSITYSQSIYTANTDFYLRVAMGCVGGFDLILKDD